jgi:hypothetical protein
MKKIYSLFFLLLGGQLFAQTTDYSTIPLSTVEECRAAEPIVLEAADLILSKPLGDASVLRATIFVIDWISKCEYTFELSGPISKLSKSGINKDLFSIFIACQSKYLINHKDLSKDTAAINEGAYNLLADYCAETSHKVEMTKEVKKLIEAKKNGTMKTYSK